MTLMSPRTRTEHLVIVRRVLLLTSVLVLGAGCSSSPDAADPAPSPRTLTVDLARQPAAEQEAALESFVASTTSGSPRPLHLVDTTIEGRELTYDLELQPSTGGGRMLQIVVDAGEGSARRVYLAPDARIIAVTATRDPTALAHGAGGGRISGTALNVLVSGQVIFDSAKSFPVRPPAEKFRFE